MTRLLMKTSLEGTWTGGGCGMSFTIKHMIDPSTPNMYRELYDYSDRGAITMSSDTPSYHDPTIGPFFYFNQSEPVKKYNFMFSIGACDASTLGGASTYGYDPFDINPLNCQSGLNCKIAGLL